MVTNVLEVVQGIEDTEDVETVLHSLLGEVIDRVIAVQRLISRFAAGNTTYG